MQAQYQEVREGGIRSLGLFSISHAKALVFLQGVTEVDFIAWDGGVEIDIFRGKRKQIIMLEDTGVSYWDNGKQLWKMKP